MQAKGKTTTPPDDVPPQGDAPTDGYSFADPAQAQGDAPTQREASTCEAQAQGDAPFNGMATHGIRSESEAPEEELDTYGPRNGFKELEPEAEQMFNDEDEADETIELPIELDDPLPQPTLPKLVLAKEMIESINTARLEDNLDEDMLERLRNPTERLSMAILSFLWEYLTILLVPPRRCILKCKNDQAVYYVVKKMQLQ